MQLTPIRPPSSLLDSNGRPLTSEAGGAETRDALDDLALAFRTGADVRKTTVSEGNAYNRQAWVYACVTAISRAVAALPFNVVDEATGDELDANPITDLFRRPEARSSRYSLWFGTIAQMELTGNAIWYLDQGDQGGGRPSEIPLGLRLLDTRTVRAVRDKRTGELMHYEHRPSGTTNQKLRLRPDQVIHYSYYNPSDPLWGQGPLTAAMTAVRTDMKAADYNERFFDAGAAPGGLLVYKRGRLTPQQEKQMREQFADRHAGHDQAHQTAILSGEWDYKQTSLGQREMEFLEQRRFSREQIGAVFQVPGILTNDPNRSNYSTASVELRIFAEHNWLPKVRYIEDVLRAQFFARFAPQTEGRFAVEQAPGLREDLGEQVERAERLFKMGVPLNDVKRLLRLELPDYEWGDTWWAPISLHPAGQETTPPVEESAVQAGLRPEGDDALLDEGLVDDTAQVIEDATDRYWRGFIKRLTPMETPFRKRTRRHFWELRQEMLANLSDWTEEAGGTYGSVDPPDWTTRFIDDRSAADDFVAYVMFDRKKANTRLREWSGPRIQQAMEVGGNMVMGELGIDSTWSLVDSPGGMQDFESRMNFITGINDTLFGQINDKLRAQLLAGGTIGDMGAAISSTLDMASTRARTVARTEVGTAVQKGRHSAMAEEGVERHRWVSARDAHVRDQHINADGEEVDVDEEFSNGLKFPLDDSGSGSTAANVVNCRCTTVPL